MERKLSRRILSQRKKNRNSRESQIVGPACSSSSSSPFELPGDWVVELRPRKTTGRSDKYYYEPGTGRQFRSLSSIQEYINREMDVAPKRLKPGDMEIVPHIFRSCLPFNLPDGWVVEEQPRANVHYAGVIDRRYIEPRTGKQFRSLRAVERYLMERKEYAASAKALKPGNLLYLTDGKDHISEPKALKSGDFAPSEIHGSEERHVPCNNKVETSGLDFCSPPERTKWVLSPGRNTWSPFINDNPVPESVHHKWSEKFVWTLSYS